MTLWERSTDTFVSASTLAGPFHSFTGCCCTVGGLSVLGPGGPGAASRSTLMLVNNERYRKHPAESLIGQLGLQYGVMGGHFPSGGMVTSPSRSIPAFFISAMTCVTKP